MSISTLLFYVLVALVTYVIAKYRQRLRYWRNLGIACEDPNFLLGNMTGLKTRRTFADIWQDYYRKFKGTGPFAGFYWFGRPAVFVLDTALAKNILIKEFNKFSDRGFYNNEADDPLTGHLFVLDGPKWKPMRNKLSPTFTSGKMKFMFPMVLKVGEELIEVIGGQLQASTILDMKDMLARFTTDVIGTCAFGIECNSMRNPQAEFKEMGRRSLTEFRCGLLGVLLRLTYPEFARRIHHKQTPDEIEEFFLRIVRETVEYREKNNIRRNDFMDMLIDLKNNKMFKSEDGQTMTNLTMEEVAAQAYVFFIAGFETSSTTMSFALYELAQHEDIQQRAREEILRVLAKHNQEFTYECMRELEYLDQIIEETLRLYTVVPVLNRSCIEDYVVPGHPKYVIKKGMPVFIPSAAFHRDAQFYPNPDTFDPDNFLPEKVQARDSVESLSFGEGPRNCVGMRFGKMQTRIGLVLLLKAFKFSVCERTKIPMEYDKESYLISSAGGIYLKVQKL